MSNSSCRSARLVALTLAVCGVARGATATLDVDAAKPGVAIPPSFFGLMTEEINHSYDGGLFAELIQNRTFQDDAKQPAHWAAVGASKLTMTRDDPVTAALPVSLKVDLPGDGAQGGVANDGYWGIPIRPDATYAVSFYAKGGDGFAGPVTASIVTSDGLANVAAATVPTISGQWQKYTLTLKTEHDAATTAAAKFVLTASGKGSVSFSLVSLFPPTYENVPGGLRPDLMQLMAGLHPAFIRLPGGNYLEGDDFPNRFDWKKMIGRAEDRPGHMGCWGYRSSDGFGLPQYLLWCRQLHADPVLAVFAGYTLKHDHVVAGPQLQPYVDEALQEIEYVSGPADSEWGKRRAADGFPEPFKLTYVEVGNEDWFDKSGSYDGRFAQFFDAIRAKYPALKVIATMPVKSRKPDLVDDHYYRSPGKMAADAGHYDTAGRAGPQIFVGEWASQEGKPTPDLNAGLADAAWLMGLQRDADLIPLECYAPLFVNVNSGAAQWGTNLIGYDAIGSFGSPSYYAQAMLAQNAGERVLPAKLDVTPAPVAATAAMPHGAVGVGTWHTQVEYKDITVTGPDGQALLAPDRSKNADAWKSARGRWTVQDGAIVSPASEGTSHAIVGDPAWTDYTVRMKARKDGGDEGFIVLFHAADLGSYRWWNVGGWGNTRAQLEASAADDEREPFGPQADFKVETGRWYDLRIEVRGAHVRCFADDKLITETDDQAGPVAKPVYASATSANDGRDVIVNVVNMGADAVETDVTVHAAGALAPTGRAIVLQGEPRDANTVDQPTKIVPREESVAGVSDRFHRVFPPHSLTILRLAVTPAAR